MAQSSQHLLLQLFAAIFQSLMQNSGYGNKNRVDKTFPCLQWTGIIYISICMVSSIIIRKGMYVLLEEGRAEVMINNVTNDIQQSLSVNTIKPR